MTPADLQALADEGRDAIFLVVELRYAAGMAEVWRDWSLDDLVNVLDRLEERAKALPKGDS